MNIQYAFLRLTRPQLEQIHQALLTHFVLEDTNRREQGLEAIEPPRVLDEIEQLLNLTEQEAHKQFHDIEDELWEYSWYTYTDEWAWHRAQQEVTKELGTRGRRMKRDALDELIEKRYRDRFETYVAEVDMREQQEVRGKKIKKTRITRK